SRAFVCLPGGFGTLDETFELLTLTQTGKGMPVPIVFLDVTGGTYWSSVDEFISRELVTRGLVHKADRDLYLVTDDVPRAVDEITRFYDNYVSMRYVGDVLVVRLRRPPTDEQLAELNERFAFLCARGEIERTTPLPDEIEDHDELELPRIKLVFAR